MSEEIHAEGPALRRAVLGDEHVEGAGERTIADEALGQERP